MNQDIFTIGITYFIVFGAASLLYAFHIYEKHSHAAAVFGGLFLFFFGLLFLTYKLLFARQGWLLSAVRFMVKGGKEYFGIKPKVELPKAQAIAGVHECLGNPFTCDYDECYDRYNLEMMKQVARLAHARSAQEKE